MYTILAGSGRVSNTISTASGIPTRCCSMKKKKNFFTEGLKSKLMMLLQKITFQNLHEIPPKKLWALIRGPDAL